MLQIIRGTTPTIKANVKSDLDLDTITAIWAYIYQRGKVMLNKKLSDVSLDLENRVISIPLTQDDTLGLKAGIYTIFQIRLLLNDGTALASTEEAGITDVQQIYKEGVISDE